MKTKKESGEKKIEPQVLDSIEWDCACEGRFRFNDGATHSKYDCYDGYSLHIGKL